MKYKYTITIMQFVPTKKEMSGTLEINHSTFDKEEQAKILFELEQKMNQMFSDMTAIRVHLNDETA